MTRSPKDPAQQFFDSRQMRRILAFGLSMGGIGAVLFWFLLGTYPYEVAVTIMFTAFVCFQWCNGLQAQQEHDPFLLDIRKSLTINPYIFYGISVGDHAPADCADAVPGIFGVVPPAPEHWGYVALSRWQLFPWSKR